MLITRSASIFQNWVLILIFRFFYFFNKKCLYGNSKYVLDLLVGLHLYVRSRLILFGIISMLNLCQMDGKKNVEQKIDTIFISLF